MSVAALEQYGLLQVTGADARAFLHAQLTNDIERLAPDRARFAGWCSAKGRLLATLLVVPRPDGFLLQLARDLAPAVVRRLAMFVLRSRAGITDATGGWHQLGVWGDAPLAALGLPVPARDLETTAGADAIAVRLEAGRCLVLAAGEAGARLRADTPAEEWILAEIRAGRPHVMQATQDQFVPQMVNLELAGGVDFRKGCYPGQEVVARAQYRGAVKRRMVHLRGAALQPGQDLYSDDLAGQASGTVVNAALGEALAVMQLSALESGAPIRVRPGGEALERLALPYAE